jgi:RecA-family ATPase
MQLPSLAQIAHALGGEVVGAQVRAPGPGHSAIDRSLSIKISDSGDDIVVNSFANDDPLEAKDYVRARLGMAAWQPKERSNGTGRSIDGEIDAALCVLPAASPPKATPETGKVIVRYDYTDVGGALLYQVERWEPKNFTQRRPDGRGGWVYKNVFESISRVPYRWQELAAAMSAYPDEPIFVCEGEKDTDNVRALGLTATCVAGGVWTPEIATVLKGRDVIYLEHNDSAGRDKSNKAGLALAGTVGSIRIVRFTDLPEKGDVSDWISLNPERHTAEALVDRCRMAPLWEPPKAEAPPLAPRSDTAEPLQWLDMSSWDHEPRPEREWAIRDRVPLKQAGLFSGEGGTGKSIIELMKNVAHVTAKGWLGSVPEPGPAFYIGAEDDKRELHIRLIDITEHYGVTFEELINGGLHILPLLGKDATLCAPTRGGKVEVTALYRQLYEAAGDIKPKNISIDTLSRAFAGSEIDRVQVYAFCNHMQALAEVAGGSVTVLSHPSLQGINSGSGISGSTAWHGAFRFRQYLKGAKAVDGEQPDDDLRELEFKKNQYGPKGESIVLRYQRGLFLPEAGISNLDKLAKGAKADELFLEILCRFADQGRNVSDKSNAPNYAPAVFAEEADVKKLGVKKMDLKAAMSRLFNAQKIYIETYGRPARPYSRLSVKR